METASWRSSRLRSINCSSFRLGGLITRRAQRLPFDGAEVLWLLGFLLTAGLLARRIVSAPERPLGGYGIWHKTPRGTVGPTASWAHAPWALAYFGLAHASWTQFDGETGRSYLGLGPGFLIVAAGFLLLRAVVRTKRSRPIWPFSWVRLAPSPRPK